MTAEQAKEYGIVDDVIASHARAPGGQRGGRRAEGRLSMARTRSRTAAR